VFFVCDQEQTYGSCSDVGGLMMTAPGPVQRECKDEYNTDNMRVSLGLVVIKRLPCSWMEVELERGTSCI
jgi:hypothetical protein